MQAPEREWKFPAGPSSGSRRLSDQLGCSRLVADVLDGLGFSDGEAARGFLTTGLEGLHDPFLLPSMEAICARIHRSIREEEPIVVYGDYDVDGMTAATLLFWVLKRLGATCEVYIPDRMSAGYGLNREAIRQLFERGMRLLVTVDNGVSAVDEVAYARGLGMTVIVTDHHTLPETLPDDTLILHPRLPGREYPFPDLCGVGVAFKLGQALLATSALPDKDEAARGFLANCLDMVAIGTIADMAPLLGENRILVREGLGQLGHTVHAGLKALLGLERLAGVRMTVDHVGFKICPKLNSAGRIDDHRVALELLMARKADVASQIALRLHGINLQRIRQVSELLDRALARSDDWTRRTLPVVVLETDKKGLMGLVAQRLREKFHKPFLVLASNGKTATGSGRSVEGFDLVGALSGARELLTRYGGHAMAVGLTLDCARLDRLSEALEAAAVSANLTAEPPVPPVAIAAVVTPEVLVEALKADLDSLAPFGKGNPAPLLAMRRVSVSRVDRLGGAGKHVRLHSPQFPGNVGNVGFNLGTDVADAMKSTSLLDLAFRLEPDVWGGREILQMKLQAVRPAI
ncbi:MAG: single-stranded-DNA-specific exonuclease RecJ [Candidatus Riflebacteria bacterium]|nr:single-stranded-DNA-specific exonuclease RecJ [Candidatus Riflebacteria bacterium]